MMYVFHTALQNRIEGLRDLRRHTRALVQVLQAQPGVAAEKKS